jgi:hypothetical protein
MDGIAAPIGEEPSRMECFTPVKGYNAAPSPLRAVNSSVARQPSKLKVVKMAVTQPVVHSTLELKEFKPAEPLDFDKVVLLLFRSLCVYLSLKMVCFLV